MSVLNILFEPYVISIIIALIITVISYFIIKEDNKNALEGEEINLSKNLLIIFIVSFILIMAISYGIIYMNKNNFFQKGGMEPNEISDKLTIVADDVEFGILED
jgi:hypothetical protein